MIFFINFTSYLRFLIIVHEMLIKNLKNSNKKKIKSEINFYLVISKSLIKHNMTVTVKDTTRVDKYCFI